MNDHTPACPAQSPTYADPYRRRIVRQKGKDAAGIAYVRSTLAVRAFTGRGNGERAAGLPFRRRKDSISPPDKVIVPGDLVELLFAVT